MLSIAHLLYVMYIMYEIDAIARQGAMFGRSLGFTSPGGGWRARRVRQGGGPLRGRTGQAED